MNEDEVTMADRLAELRAWGTSRIGECRRQEEKFGRAWEHHEKHQKGPPQALVEAWSERRALQAVFSILGLTEIGQRTPHPSPKEEP